MEIDDALVAALEWNEAAGWCDSVEALASIPGNPAGAEVDRVGAVPIPIVASYRDGFFNCVTGSAPLAPDHRRGRAGLLARPLGGLRRAARRAEPVHAESAARRVPARIPSLELRRWTGEGLSGARGSSTALAPLDFGTTVAKDRMASRRLPVLQRGRSEHRTGRGTMELYAIIRRDGWRTGEELQAAAGRSSDIGDNEMPDDIRWIRSYVLSEEAGGLGTVCIYEASSPEAIREHAERAFLPVTEIVPIADTVVVRPDPAA